MKLKLTSLLFILTLSIVASANDEICYKISLNENMWSRTPELLCVETVDFEQDEFSITLRTGFPKLLTIATFNLNLLERAKGLKENQDKFGIANPSNSTFNALAIQFMGTRDPETKTEKGQVTIGSTSFYYRKN